MVTRLIVVTLLLTATANGAEICAVTVSVTDADAGVPLRVPVELIGPDGKAAAQTQTDQNGRARFCDMGFGEHSILVGGDACNSVMIRRVSFHYPDEYNFRVQLSVCKGAGDGGATACVVYFRVVSQTGEPPSRITIRSDISPRSWTTDRFGRAIDLIPLSRKAPAHVTFESPDYEPQTVEAICDNRWRMERLVTLKRRSQPAQVR